MVCSDIVKSSNFTSIDVAFIKSSVDVYFTKPFQLTYSFNFMLFKD